MTDNNILTGKDFCKKFRKLRIESGKTQQQLAKEIGISYTAIKDLESKPMACKNLRTESTLNILKVLKCDLEYLFGEQEQPRKEIASAATTTGLSYGTIERIASISKIQPHRIVLDAILSNQQLEKAISYIFVAIANQRSFADHSFDGAVYTPSISALLGQAQESVNEDVVPTLVKMIELYSSEFMVIPREDGCIRYKQESCRIFTEIVEATLKTANTEEMTNFLRNYSKNVIHSWSEEDGKHKEDNE